MVCFRSLILMNRGRKLPHGACDARSALQNVSQEASLFKQEHKWTLLSGCWVPKWCLSEPSVVPELEPLEVVRSLLDVVLVAMMLEVKLLVTEQGWCCLGA